MDGAAGLPLPEHNGRTCLELAETPHLDLLVSTGILGMAKTIPTGMEPSSSNGCMSVLGYDPAAYPVGRAAIEATSLGIPVDEGESLVFDDVPKGDFEVVFNHGCSSINAIQFYLYYI